MEFLVKDMQLGQPFLLSKLNALDADASALTVREIEFFLLALSFDNDLTDPRIAPDTGFLRMRATAIVKQYLTDNSQVRQFFLQNSHHLIQ